MAGHDRMHATLIWKNAIRKVVVLIDESSASASEIVSEPW